MLKVGLIVPQGFATLSFAPLTVFETANSVLEQPFYEVHVTSESGGRVQNSFGMEIMTERVTDTTFDTLLVGSAPDLRAPSPQLLSFLHGAPATTRRIASICVGAFILGEAGLLDGRRSTTHWLFAKELQRRYPKTSVEVDRIFIADGPVWTSAGMTAGIDLALSLVERDIGREKARDAARTMVVHHRRAGGQSQHSALLDLDAKSDRVQNALQFARRNLGASLTVEKLAEAACLSPRQFSRVFRDETGLSPAKAIESLRLEAARLMLEQGRLPLETIAAESGFGDRERMRRSFVRTFGQSPQAIRNAASPLASF
ncbi:MAG TPA: GlxA family transcriptional regulator [Casimicrobiaceae bacterium]|nr:GlxA family transcriptional regulator [Casimicrobiaceae bacterium]